MKILSWNVNGVRAAQKNGFLNWFKDQKADVVCLQETKARQEQLDEELVHPKGYDSIWHSAEKPGYSGVALYFRKEPLNIQHGLGIHDFDSEGRVLIAQYKDFYLINAYFPNSGRDVSRLPYKLKFCEAILKKCESVRKSGKNIILCGDYNIAHKAIDLKNPKTNEKTAGYLPQERAWMDEFTEKGYVDTFRLFEPDSGHYTWWSYRPGIRDRNIGWRIDYFCVNPEYKKQIKKSLHQTRVKGSDHCPIALEIQS